MALVARNAIAGDAFLVHKVTSEMQPASLSGRQQQLGLLMGRAQPDVLEAARVAALLNGQSSSFGLQSGLGSAGLGSGVLAGLGGTSGGLNLGLGPLPQPSQQVQQASQLDQLALLSQFPHALFPPQQYSSTDRDLQLGGLRNVGKTRSSDSRSSSAYASRHQAAEQRRRTRINERLDLLRKLVPHAERANTACFLEEVIKYIENLKRRTLELEAMLEAATGKPVTKSLASQGVPTGSTLSALEPAPDTQAPSPRQPPPPPSRQLSGPHMQAMGAPNPSTSPLAPPAPPSLGAAQTLQPPSQQLGQQQQQDLGQQQQQGLDSLSGGAGGGGGASAGSGSANTAGPQQHRQSPQLQLSPALSSQLAHLLPGAGATAGQQGGALGALFPHAGGSLSLPTGSLSLGGGGGAGASALSLSQLAGLQHHGGGVLSSHGGSHNGLTSSSGHGITQQQLNDLHTLQAMHSLQQHHVRVAAAAAAAAAGGAGGLGGGINSVHGHAARHHPPVFHPTNNKAFLHFNEDFFGGSKPELLSSRSLLGAAASTTPSTSLQLTSAHLPTDSNTLLQVETARKTLSGSPVSSEESGVPLKKRKVLLL